MSESSSNPGTIMSSEGNECDVNEFCSKNTSETSKGSSNYERETGDTFLNEQSTFANDLTMKPKRKSMHKP